MAEYSRPKRNKRSVAFQLLHQQTPAHKQHVGTVGFFETELEVLKWFGTYGEVRTCIWGCPRLLQQSEPILKRPPPNPPPPPDVQWGGIFLNTRNRNIAEFAQGGRSFLCCLTQPRPKMKVPFYSVTSNQCINKMTALPATNFVLELLRSFQCFICLCFAKRGFLSSICSCRICFLIRRTEGRSLVACLGIIC